MEHEHEDQEEGRDESTGSVTDESVSIETNTLRTYDSDTSSVATRSSSTRRGEIKNIFFLLGIDTTDFGYVTSYQCVQPELAYGSDGEQGRNTSELMCLQLYPCGQSVQ